jgi:uncharacterized protein (TIGR00251 family)
MDSAIKETENGVLINLDVSPNAKKTEIAGYNEWRKAIAVRVGSPPKGGKANAELIKYFEKVFGKDVKIVKGQTSTQKTILVEGITKDEAIKILKQYIQ